MINKLDAIVVDSDFEYINTFLGYLKTLLDIIVGAFKSLMGMVEGE